MIYVGNKKYSLYVGDKRREMIIPKSLPYDAEIEYLQFTGTQYIDTGFIPDGNSCIEVVCHITAFETIVCGSSIQYNNRAFELYSYGGTVQVSYGNTFNVRALTYDNSLYYKQVIDKGVATTYDLSGNVVQTYDFGTSTFTCPNTMFIGALHRGNNGQTIIVNTKTFEIKSFVIKDNGVVVRDYIPVRVGQTGYLYDKVSGQLFGNAGTGDFVLGPDKSPSILPSGYTQILGVKNASTAYLPAPNINAGVRYELEIEATNNFGNGLFSFNSGGNYEIIVFFNGSSDSYLNGKFTLEGFSLNTKFKIVLDLAMESEYARLYINDELVRQTTLHVNIGKDIGIFKDLNRNTYVKGVLYSFRGYKDDVLINDYIPAIRNSDGKVGVYDIASNEFVLSPNDVDFEAVLQ